MRRRFSKNSPSSVHTAAVVVTAFVSCSNYWNVSVVFGTHKQVVFDIIAACGRFKNKTTQLCSLNKTEKACKYICLQHLPVHAYRFSVGLWSS